MLQSIKRSDRGIDTARHDTHQGRAAKGKTPTKGGKKKKAGRGLDHLVKLCLPVCVGGRVFVDGMSVVLSVVLG